MLRYLYPLIMLVLVLVLCRCVPLPFLTDNAFGSALTFFSAVGITMIWPFFVGNRLHEPSWRKLAQQLHLTYKPYGTGVGKQKSARVEGIYRGRDVQLTTYRVSIRRRRGPLIEAYMSLKLKVNAPAHFKMEIRNKPKFGTNPQLEEMPKTGDANFDRRLVLFFRPYFM